MGTSDWDSRTLPRFDTRFARSILYEKTYGHYNKNCMFLHTRVKCDGIRVKSDGHEACIPPLTVLLFFPRMQDRFFSFHFQKKDLKQMSS